MFGVGSGMSKYDPLWRHVGGHDSPSFTMTFGEIHEVLGFEIDHSFLNAKKDLADYGYEVGRISIKNKTVSFKRIG